MIQLKNVTKHFQLPTGKIVALTDINFHVPKGKIFGVIGKSGAGKSTLIRCVNRLECPTTGSVVVDGQQLETLDKQQLRDLRRNIGMIFQHFNLLFTRSVWDNIALPLQLIGKTKREIANAVTPLLELTGLLDKKSHYPAQLSGGQKQRVAIARALANQPKVLLSDEATSSLDPQTTAAILNLLKDINQQLGLTILLITHEVEVIKQICDHVALIEQGQIIEQAEIAEFFTHPQTTLAKEYVRAGMKLELISSIQEKLQQQYVAGACQVLRISFYGKVTSQPWISQLIKKYDLTINILQANIEAIKRDIIGMMVVSIQGDLPQLDAGLKYLKRQGVAVEAMGYLKNNSINCLTSSSSACLPTSSSARLSTSSSAKAGDPGGI